MRIHRKKTCPPKPYRTSKINSRDKLRKRYLRWKKNILEFESSGVQELGLSTLTQMFDPHTTFMNIKEKEKFDQQMNNEFVGIGAVLRDEDGFCTIKELLPGGPAEGSRELEPDGVILKVAQAEGEFIRCREHETRENSRAYQGSEGYLGSFGD